MPAPAVGGGGGPQSVAILGVPQIFSVPAAQRINLFAVSKRQRKVCNMTLEIEGFVSNYLANQQHLIKFFTIIEAGNRDHQRRLGINVAANRPRIIADAEVREWIILQ